MSVTLLLIYTVGFGNIATSTEKFRFPRECEAVKSDLKQFLKDKIIFVKCYHD